MYPKLSIGGFAYSLNMPSREWIIDQILLMLDRQPCHGYELKRLLSPVIDKIELTTLYRWLHTMEKESLVDSTVQAGPHGPSRRVYRVGERGESRLRRILRDALGVILHFYDAYRHFTFREMFKTTSLEEVELTQGSVLVSVISHLLAREVELIQYLAHRTGKEPLYVLGDPSVWNELNLRCEGVPGVPWDIACRNNRFAEVWVLGVPPRPQIPQTVVEMKRVLQAGGMGRIHAPFVFFDEPTEPTLDAFIRITASHLFPELNVADGQEILTVIKRYFDQYGTVQFFHGYVEFWGVKESDT